MRQYKYVLNYVENGIRMQVEIDAEVGSHPYTANLLQVQCPWMSDFCITGIPE